MLNPVVIPAPAALLIIALLAAALAWRWEPITLRPQPRPARPVGRHRIGVASQPYRRPGLDYTVIALPAADWRQPLTPFELRAGVVEIAGHDDRPTVEFAAEDTRELAVSR